MSGTIKKEDLLRFIRGCRKDSRCLGADALTILDYIEKFCENDGAARPEEVDDWASTGRTSECPLEKTPYYTPYKPASRMDA